MIEEQEVQDSCREAIDVIGAEAVADLTDLGLVPVRRDWLKRLIKVSQWARYLVVEAPDSDDGLARYRATQGLTKAVAVFDEEEEEEELND